MFRAMNRLLESVSNNQDQSNEEEEVIFPTNEFQDKASSPSSLDDSLTTHNAIPLKYSLLENSTKQIDNPQSFDISSEVVQKSLQDEKTIPLLYEQDIPKIWSLKSVKQEELPIIVKKHIEIEKTNSAPSVPIIYPSYEKNKGQNTILGENEIAAQQSIPIATENEEEVVDDWSEEEYPEDEPLQEQNVVPLSFASSSNTVSAPTSLAASSAPITQPQKVSTAIPLPNSNVTAVPSGSIASTSSSQQSQPQKSERLRAPKGGIIIDGKFFKGGQFLPNSAASQMSALLASTSSNHSTSTSTTTSTTAPIAVAIPVNTATTRSSTTPVPAPVSSSATTSSSVSQQSSPAKSTPKRAPKGGVEIDGKFYKGGQFIPNK